MKSQAELSHIIDIVNRLGASPSGISFRLIGDGKEMTRAAGTGQLRQAIAGIYGLLVPKKWLRLRILTDKFLVLSHCLVDTG